MLLSIFTQNRNEAQHPFRAMAYLFLFARGVGGGGGGGHPIIRGFRAGIGGGRVEKRERVENVRSI